METNKTNDLQAKLFLLMCQDIILNVTVYQVFHVENSVLPLWISGEVFLYFEKSYNESAKRCTDNETSPYGTWDAGNEVIT